MAQIGCSCQPKGKRLQDLYEPKRRKVFFRLFRVYNTKDVKGYNPDSVLLGSSNSIKVDKLI
jgi:hypothetical protein